MLDEYSDYYSEAAQIFSRYGSSLASIGFHGQKQALEVFCLMTISLCESHAKAVSVLLKNDCGVEPIIVIRGLFEVFCNSFWVSRTDSTVEQNERLFRLEATPYREIVKELRLIQKDVHSASPYWKEKEYEQLMALVENVAEKCPWLLNLPSSDPLNFKQAPPLTDRLGETMRLRFYHLYRFSSVFTHPTPMMKAVFIHPAGSNLKRNEVIEEPLQQFLAYGLWFLKLNLHFCQQVFSACDTERTPLRTEYYNSMCAVVEKGRKNYFSFREPGTGGVQSP
jgi:hypothetical protein